MNNISHQYMAGIIDSDGSLTISRRVRKNHAPTFECKFSLQWRLSDKSEEIINQMKNIYGGRIYIVPYKYGKMICYQLANKEWS